MDWSKQAPRSVLWAFVLLAALGGLVALVFSSLLMSAIGDWGIAPFVAYLLALTAPLVVLSIGRLNDIGWPRPLVLVYLIPVLGALLLVPLLLAPSAVAAAEHRHQRLAQRHAEKQRALAETAARAAAACADDALRALSAAQQRLVELQSGRGAPLGCAGEAVLHEFWISVPGYAGSVRGARARVEQHGDIHSVSDVSGTTKSGLGEAVVGGLAFGPVGAVVGSNIGRKTTVETTARTVDTRSYAIEVEGPHFFYCTDSTDAHALRAFRDLVNERGSSGEDLAALTELQRSVVHDREVGARQAIAASEQAESALSACTVQLREIRFSGGRAYGEGTSLSPVPGTAGPGWYPDPSRQHHHRYWNGSEWTSGVADNGIAKNEMLASK